jgi:hypothetical protein
MFATIFFFASFVVPEPAVAFPIVMSHLMPLFTVVLGIRQMGANYPSSRSTWQRGVQSSIAIVIDWTFQLRSLRVVTSSAPL